MNNYKMFSFQHSNDPNIFLFDVQLLELTITIYFVKPDKEEWYDLLSALRDGKNTKTISKINRRLSSQIASFQSGNSAKLSVYQEKMVIDIYFIVDGRLDAIKLKLPAGMCVKAVEDAYSTYA
jgi:hypothetical protein